MNANNNKTMLQSMLLRYQSIQQQVLNEYTQPGKNLEEFGRLEVSDRGHSNYYYYHCWKDRETGERVRRYIPKNQLATARKLAQKTYQKNILKLTRLRSSQLERVLRDFEDNEIEALYTSLHPARRALIAPVEPLEISWEERREKWLKIPYQGLGWREEDRHYVTNNHEKVRSKSEKILADLFFRQGIAYKYECPLFFADQSVLYPDFTFLDPHTDQEIYWEHFGMMDDPTYAQNCLRKINTYANQGIILYDRLLASFETRKSSLDERVVHYWINKKLKCRA